MPGGLPGDAEGKEAEHIRDVDGEKTGERILGDHKSGRRCAEGERDRPHAERRHVPVLQPSQREKTRENRANDEKHGRQCLSVECHERQPPQFEAVARTIHSRRKATVNAATHRRSVGALQLSASSVVFTVVASSFSENGFGRN